MNFINEDNSNDEFEHLEQLKGLCGVLDRNSEGVFLARINGDIIWTNKALNTMFDKSHLDLCEEGLSLSFEEEPGSNYYTTIFENTMKDGEWSGEVYFTDSQENNKIILLKMFLLKSTEPSNNKIGGVLKDITDEKNKDKLIYRLTNMDNLTNIFNKEYFIKQLEKQIMDAQIGCDKLAVIYLDLNCFKTINDSQGRFVGDETLKCFTRQLKQCVREEGITARVGGDEFAILLPHLKNADDVYIVTDRLISQLNNPIVVNQQEIFVTFSAGICIYPDDTSSPEEIIHYADIAMHNARNEKDKNIVRFTNIMKDNLDEFFNISNHLRSAIEKNELTLNYQPIVDINTEVIVGAEVLLRWNNKFLGSVSPVKFIPIAEAGGQILEIGEWVLREACKQSMEWYNKGYERLPLAVNVSIKQLEDHDFIQKLKNIINETGIDPTYLEVEITESISPEDYDDILIVLEQIKKFGIKISIDDFGTGYSSLSRLKAMAIHKLKIDRAFINDLNENDKTELVSSIIALGKSLDLKLVAEGIENVMQLGFLKDKSCQLGQGFLFSKPVDKDLFEKNLLLRSE